MIQTVSSHVQAPNSKTKKNVEKKIGVNVPQLTVVSNFSLKGQKSCRMDPEHRHENFLLNMYRLIIGTFITDILQTGDRQTDGWTGKTRNAAN